MTDEARAAAASWGATHVRLILARENAVHEIALPDGTRAALRLHRIGYQTQASIASELWWCGELAAVGVPVATPVPSRAGNLLEPLATGRLASVVRWIDGTPLGTAGVPFPEPVAVQTDRHFRIGQLLRRLHGASDGLTLPATFTRPRWDADGLVGERPFWGRFWEHPRASYAQLSALSAARAAVRDHLARLKADTGLIHADVLRENVLFSEGYPALIDFDDSGFGYRLYDLGTVLSQNQYEPARDELRDALMAGYGTQDVESVELFTMARTLASVGWTMPRLAPDDPIHISHLARAEMVARRILA